uniref:63 kDa sperm flagellar membrane protein-like n=1 Tax=Ciona intestinalis TaxID=7719 RepID=UPI00089DC6F5|nr:63 kDa sperm flagellar membrane protein-like [Ciona intestinalis]|eukprot:XP_018667739.1 63 kDa sperm flagellar membrane protein-like [Ciona intestinalis]
MKWKLLFIAITYIALARSATGQSSVESAVSRLVLSISNCATVACQTAIQEQLNQIAASQNISIGFQDLNECNQISRGNCSEFADCINTPGSHECVCRSGFVDESPSLPGRVCTGKKPSPPLPPPPHRSIV